MGTLTVRAEQPENRGKESQIEERPLPADFVSESLRPYSIGEKLRALRLRKKLGLIELGKHTGFSAALLSKLERGKL